MLRSWGILFLLVLVGGNSLRVAGSSSGTLQRQCDYLEANAIFVGTVVEAVELKPNEGRWKNSFRVRVAVEEVLYGKVGKQTEVYAGLGANDCDPIWRPGARVLVFALEQGSGLWTERCNKDRLLQGSPGEDGLLETLRESAREVRGIRGFVRRSDADYYHGSERFDVPDVVVRAESGSFKASTRTRTDGTFELNGLPAGKYKVGVEKPAGFRYEESDGEEEIEVTEDGCAKVNFMLLPATHIRGQVKLPADAGEREIRVVAFPVHPEKATDEEPPTAYTDKDGHFDIFPLPPGDYIVGANANAALSREMPFPVTYYPGVTTKNEAAVVHVKEGEARELEINLTEMHALRTVQFVAIGLDGEPLRVFYVDLEDLEHPGEISGRAEIGTNDGSGSLMIFAGHAYHLHAHRRQGEVEWCSRPVRIAAGSKPVRARIAIDRIAERCDIAAIDGSDKPEALAR